MTTPPIQTLTDELLGEIERKASSKQMEGFALVHNIDCVAVMSLVTELRTLRAENAELRKDAGRLQFVIEEGITISQMNGTGMPMVYQCQWHDCRQIDWYPSAIEAIDAAIAMEQAK
jgi:hypothetical protein